MLTESPSPLPRLILTVYTVWSISSCRKLYSRAPCPGDALSRVCNGTSGGRLAASPPPRRGLTGLWLLSRGCRDADPSRGAGRGPLGSGSSARGPGLRLRAPEVCLPAIPQGAPPPLRPPSRRREGSGAGEAGGRGVPVIKRGLLPRRPGQLGPRGGRTCGRRSVRAARSGALGSRPRAAAGATGGAGPGDAGLGEDGGP